MEEPENKPPENNPAEAKHLEPPASPNRKALEDISWDIPFGQTIYNFFVREGRAVKNGWVAVSIFVIIAFLATRSYVKSGVEDEKSAITNNFVPKIEDLNGQLRDAKADRDKYQIMLAPFQAAALKLYTNYPLQNRLDLLADELGGLSRQAQIRLQINSETNLLESEVEPNSTVTFSNFITLTNRTIKLVLANSSKFPAVNGIIDIDLPLDPTNLNMPGWFLEPPDENGRNHWLYKIDTSTLRRIVHHISTIEISTNYPGGYVIGDIIIGADNAQMREYFVGFTVPPLTNKSVTNILDR